MQNLFPSILCTYVQSYVLVAEYLILMSLRICYYKHSKWTERNELPGHKSITFTHG